jgi:hypothetical protein
MTTIRSALGALLVAALSCICAQAHAAPPASSPGASKHVDATRCNASVCRLSVKVDGDCGITVDPDWLFISGKNVRLVWEILPAGYYFPPFQGVRFKDEYNPAWRGEFFEQGRGEGLGTDMAQAPGGPKRESVWGDVNSQPGVFRYAITVINARTGQECSADPGVVNDWE